VFPEAARQRAGIAYDARFVCGSLGKKYKVPSCGQQVAAK